MSMKEAPIIIAGGGLAGCLAALALAERRPEVDFLLIEREEGFGGNHIWSFFDSDVAPEHRWLVEPLISARWPEHEVRFPARSRSIQLGYNSIRSQQLDQDVSAKVRPQMRLTGRSISEIGPRHVVADGERIEAAAVIDARGMEPAHGLDLKWQKFVGRTFAFEGGHGCERPIIMDACVDQQSGYRFVYSLPFTPSSLMVEDTYYSDSPELDLPLLRGRLDAYLHAQGLAPSSMESEESGVLPVLLGGELARLWPASAPPIARLGLKGGFFHPTTGYSLPDAVRNAILLAEQAHFGAEALLFLYRTRAQRLWEERSFYQLLNRMLFRAAKPDQRYRVLEHFYRLPEAVIARFYSGDVTALDKLRILSGRPPVPIGAALYAARERRA